MCAGFCTVFDVLRVSLIIPAYNEQERIADCLRNAIVQTVPAHEILVVDNRSTDQTVAEVQRMMDQYPDAPIRLLHQRAEQGLIATRDFGFDHATGDILGRFDADCMLRPDWVEHVSELFEQHPEVMGATGPVTYYDMPARHFSLKSDDSLRRWTFRADHNAVLLFGSNMALRASAWQQIRDAVCHDPADIMHEDIDISLHLLNMDLPTFYSSDMVCGISARRMDTSLTSFRNYMRRFKHTFEAHPDHWRKRKSEHVLYAAYPALHMLFPLYRRYLQHRDINPAERAWLRERVDLNLDDQWIPDDESTEVVADTPTTALPDTLDTDTPADTPDKAQ